MLLLSSRPRDAGQVRGVHENPRLDSARTDSAAVLSLIRRSRPALSPSAKSRSTAVTDEPRRSGTMWHRQSCYVDKLDNREEARRRLLYISREENVICIVYLLLQHHIFRISFFFPFLSLHYIVYLPIYKIEITRSAITVENALRLSRFSQGGGIPEAIRRAASS